MQELEAQGIAPGMYKGGFNSDDIETQILIDHHEMAWIDIQCRGVVLVVEGRAGRGRCQRWLTTRGRAMWWPKRPHISKV